VRWLDFPLQRDEGEYAYAGQLILGGIPPYEIAYNMKMPGTYLAYAAMMAVFGQTTTGIHLGLLSVHLASLVFLFLIAQRFFGISGAAVATSAYTLMTLSPALVGMAAQATHFAVFFALMGIWVLLRLEEKHSWLNCLMSGLLFGTAFQMKQHALFLGVFGGLYVAWLCIREEASPASTSLTERTRIIALRLGAFSAGCLLPFLAVCAWLKMAGVFPQFWFWTFKYAREYVSILTFRDGLRKARLAFGATFHAAIALWTIVAFGLALLCTARMDLNRRLFLGGFFIFSFLAICPGYYFRANYFVLLMPAVALVIGFAVWYGEAWFARTQGPLWLRHLPLVIAILACAESLYVYRQALFTLPVVEACRRVYPHPSPFPESIDVARYIEANTSPNERIAVIGSEPQIYFYAHRLSSTGFIYTYALMESQRYARVMQENMIHDLEQNPPTYLVYVSIPNSWLMQPNSSRLLLDWVDRYVDKNMTRVGIFQYDGADSTAPPQVLWGPAAATAPLRNPYYISIFKRN